MATSHPMILFLTSDPGLKRLRIVAALTLNRQLSPVHIGVAIGAILG